MKKINIYLRQLHAVWFILLFLLLTIVFSTIFPQLEYFGVSNYHFYPTPDQWGMELWESLLLSVIFAPFVETFLAQTLPYWLLSRIRYFSKNKGGIILISALFFAVMHNYSMHYIIYAFLMGIVLMYAYITRLRKSPYWTVVVIHALLNLTVVILDIFFPSS